MNRRKFIGLTAAAGASAALTGCTKGTEPKPEELKASDTAVKLAGMTLEELREEHRHWMLDDFVPFMDKFVVDHELGGFMCTVDRDGTQLSSDKTTWYEGRGIWTYSYLYNKVEQNPRYLEIARKSVEFISKQNPTGPELMPARYTKEGKPLGEGPDPIFYGDVFVANGFQEYSKIKGNEEYWDIAKKILLKCVDIYDNRPGYADIPAGPSRIPGFTRGAGSGARTGPRARRARPLEGPAGPPRSARDTFVGGAIIPGVERPRLCGHWMVLLNCAQQMLETRQDPEIEAIARRSVDAVMNYHFNPEYRLINEQVNHDLSRIESEHGQVATGHGPETLWMILYDAVRTKDKALFDRAAEYLRRSAEVFWDDVYGGMLAGLDHVDLNIWNVAQKSLWLQQEMLIGFLCLIEHTGAQWAKDWYAKLHEYVMAKFPLKQYGFPLWIAYADRKITFVKNYNRCEHFHHPRYLMQNMLALDRMIARKGGLSGLFA
jgi:mannose/cellobiose epimerase-like protein (N-acyl-D-glucosamine 2-epimerase family)